ncbi:MAG: hypothetical protein JWR51_1913 [Devosia sp.]|uniref:hypothetical protein n=1 Tax=Devosia sp. TaxID=1871048 RepID=UPI002626773C|nr:hypothetical protein [Devosia sp.]MDB5528810.1 hypothetical protein [Devosia sp.]
MTQRNVWLVVMSVAVGPLIGSLAFMAGMTLYDWLSQAGGPGAVRFVLDYWPIMLTGGYVLGFIPALIFAIAMANLSSRISSRRTRLAIAALLGAVISLVIVGFFTVGGFGGMTASVLVLMAVAVTGAVAGLVCMAVIEWLHPLHKPAPTAAT